MAEDREVRGVDEAVAEDREVRDVDEAVEEDREVRGVDEAVEEALLKSALGYNVTVRKPVKLKEVRNKAGEGRVEIERIEYAEEQVHVPGKITAQIYWLKRRDGGKGEDGGGVDPLEAVLRRWDEAAEEEETEL